MRAIFWGGLIAGILDIMSAIVITLMRNGKPIRMLQGIASGILGKSSFEGGLPTAALGLAIHFFIAFTAATVFYLLSRRIPFLTRQAVVSGFAYGIAVYLVMYHVVMPLVDMHPKRTFSAIATAVLIHMFLVGLPIALATKRLQVS